MKHIVKIIVILLFILPNIVRSDAVLLEGKIPVTFNVSTKNNLGTVILAHGCYGITNREYRYAEMFNLEGFNTAIIDSWAYRGIMRDSGPNSVCQTYKVSGEQRLDEVYKTVEWIQQQTWHSGRIFLIGYSHGGVVALAASNKPPERGLNKVVAFYPYCFSNFHREPLIPIQVHIGSADDWTPARLCRGMYDGFFRKYKYGEYYEYPNAHHGFDSVGADIVVPGLGHGGVVKNRTFKYDEKTTKIAYDRVLKFFKE